MEIFSSVNELRRKLKGFEQSKIGFVPTMGALHEGHRSLVERACCECEVVVVSIFVNPTQFNDKRDLVNYPRTPESDIRLVEEAGADFIFMPTIDTIYPEPDSREFEFGSIGSVMEGATRPGHFNGVAQVVSTLFSIVNPGRAYFGEKDFQQIAIIREMVKLLALNVEIIDCDIIRSGDGLALSSRNALLSQECREAAPHIYAMLKSATSLVDTMSPKELQSWIIAAVESNPMLKVIYYQSVNAQSLSEVEQWSDSDRIQGCIAVQAGNIRLIDNIRIR